MAAVKKKKPLSAAQRKANERSRKKEMGLVGREVWVHPDDWIEVRKLEKKLVKKRFGS